MMMASPSSNGSHCSGNSSAHSPPASNASLNCVQSNILIINGTNSADYLAQLIKDRNRLAAFPNVFVHIQRLVDNGKSMCCYCTCLTLLTTLHHSDLHKHKSVLRITITWSWRENISQIITKSHYYPTKSLNVPLIVPIKWPMVLKRHWITFIWSTNNHLLNYDVPTIAISQISAHQTTSHSLSSLFLSLSHFSSHSILINFLFWPSLVRIHLQ